MTYQEERQAMKAGYNEAKYRKEVLNIKPDKIIITAEWAKYDYSFIWAQGFNAFCEGVKYEEL